MHSVVRQVFRLAPAGRSRACSQADNCAVAGLELVNAGPRRGCHSNLSHLCLERDLVPALLLASVHNSLEVPRLGRTGMLFLVSGGMTPSVVQDTL